MAYPNNLLVAYTKLSHKHPEQRTHAIEHISTHYVVGQCTAAGLSGWFYKSST